MRISARVCLLVFYTFLSGQCNSPAQVFGSPGSPEDSSPNRFDAIDKHALSTPASVERSVNNLAEYLTRPARNDEEKARAIFRWIAENITYDAQTYFTGDVRASTSDQTLKSRTAVCEGFSGLFKSLGKAAGLEIRTIRGYAKGYNSRVGERSGGPPNHAWNAVKIGSEWQLMDATWGGGYLNEKGEYVRSFNGYFFFTPPEKFIFTHFPENSKWQLLDKPVSRDDFEKLAFLRPAFFQYGLELNSHNSCTIEAVDTILVTLRAPEETVLLAHLVQNETPLESDLAFAQKDNGRVYVSAVFPASGTYVLRLFAKWKTDPGPAEWALDYQVHARKVGSETICFPEPYQAFVDCGGFLEGPMHGRLKSGRIYKFRIRIPAAERAVVSYGKKWTDLKKQGDWFEGDVTAVKGVMHVFAQFPGGQQYQGLLKYAGY
jgi:hypothetical protein